MPGSANAADYDCSDFSNQAQAQQYLLPGDPYGLDADQEGGACESLPCPCSSGSTVPSTPVPPTAPLPPVATPPPVEPEPEPQPQPPPVYWKSFQEPLPVYGRACTEQLERLSLRLRGLAPRLRDSAIPFGFSGVLSPGFATSTRREFFGLDHQRAEWHLESFGDQPDAAP